MNATRLSSATRLVLAFGGIVLLIAVAGGLALASLVRDDEARLAQAERGAREIALAQQMQAAALDAGRLPPEAVPSRSGLAAAAQTAVERYAQLRTALGQLPPSPEAGAARAAADAAAAAARSALLPTMELGADAVADGPPALPADGRQTALLAWVQALQVHAEAVRGAAQAREQAAQAPRETFRRVATAGLVASAALAALLGLWAVRGLRRELGTDPGQLKAAAERLGQGELYHALDRRDARDSVVDAFDRMREALAALALAVRHAAHDTAGAGRELATGQDELRGRVEQQAAMQQQALAAVQALGAALRRGAAEADQARALAEELQALATRGAEAMAQAFDSVRELQSGDPGLGELAQAVEGVAFQAHLLAVNAALEAGRVTSPAPAETGLPQQARELAQRCAETARRLRAAAAGRDAASTQRSLALAAQADAALQGLGGTANRLVRSGAGLELLAQENAEGAERIDRTLAQLGEAARQTALMVERNSAAAAVLRAHSGELLAALSPLKPLPGSGPDLAAVPPLALDTVPGADEARPLRPADDGTPGAGS
jgi:methyl-accepting chemotaxis protein